MTGRPIIPPLPRLAELATLLTGRPDARPEDAIAWLQELTAALSIPGLASYGLDRRRDRGGGRRRSAGQQHAREPDRAHRRRGQRDRGPVPVTKLAEQCAYAAAGLGGANLVTLGLMYAVEVPRNGPYVFGAINDFGGGLYFLPRDRSAATATEHRPAASRGHGPIRRPRHPSEGARRRRRDRRSHGRIAADQRTVPTGPVGRPGTAYAGTGTLKPFGSCDSVLKYFQDQAPDYLIERAGGGDFAERGSGPMQRVGASPARDTGAAAGGAEPPAHSTTNVQEAGVDEPDLVKTDGERIVAVAQARVHLVSVRRRPDDAAQDSSRDLGPATSSSRVTACWCSAVGSAENVEPGLRWAGQQAVLTMYDIADLSRSRADRHLDHRRRRARRPAGGDAGPGGDGCLPRRRRAVADLLPDGRISERSKGQLRAAIAKTQVDDWVPTYTLEDGAGAPVGRGTAGGMRRPGAAGDVLRARHRGRLLVRHGVGAAVPPDGRA